MELLKQQGKIRYWGLSLNTFYPEPEADLMMNNKQGDGFQLVYNIINQRALSLLKKAKEEQYGIIARMPLQFGLLTGKFAAGSGFGADDHRSFRFTNEILNKALKILEESIWPLCEKYNTSKTAMALSYILSHDAVSTVIPGIRTAQHAIDNTTGIIRLTAGDIALIESVYDQGLAEVVALMEKQG